MKPDEREQKKKAESSQQASALIVVLWVIGLLSILVSSFAFDAHIEARITSYYRKRTKADYLARSGIQIAELLMARSAEMKKNRGRESEEEDEEDRWQEPARQLSEGLAIRGLVEELGDGTITVDIVPEPARRNVNRLGRTDIEKEENWERILEVGNVPEEMWPELIESFLDWTDRDDTARIDGAETEDYYSTLDRPYRAKNGPLDTVGELLLVKGFTDTILSGGVLETEDVEDEEEEPVRISGIKDLLTTYGDIRGRVNVNAASKRVLMTLLEIDELLADVIIEEREGLVDEEGQREDSSFLNVNDLFARIPELDPSLRRHVTTGSKIYRVTSTGTVQGVKKQVWCIVQYAGGKMSILRWREDG